MADDYLEHPRRSLRVNALILGGVAVTALAYTIVFTGKAGLAAPAPIRALAGRRYVRLHCASYGPVRLVAIRPPTLTRRSRTTEIRADLNVRI
jgi:hypothetical protein